MKPIDTVDECVYILDFISHCFSQTAPHDSPQTMSHNAQTGLALLLNETSRRLTNVGDTLSKNEHKMEVQND